MATIKANKDKARFVSNTISQDALDGDWVDHEVITKYKLPEIVLEGGTTTTSIESSVALTTGDSLLVYNATDGIVERVVGTPVTTSGVGQLITNGTFDTDTSGWTATAATLSVNAGRLSVATAGQINGLASQLMTGLTIGVLYHCSIDIIASSGIYTDFRIGTTQNGFETYLQAEGTLNGTYTFSFTATATSHYFTVKTYHGTTLFDNISVVGVILYQAPITATTNIPTKAYFNKTIDTTLSAEATGKCKSSTVTQIGVL